MSDDPRGRAGVPDEAALLREARALMPGVDAEPRPGFAARVAAHAAGQRQGPAFAPRWLLAFGGGALVAGAAAVLLALSPKAGPTAVALEEGHRAHGAGVLAMEERAGNLAVAQHLELFEELPLAQHEEALEELDVVEVLHTLRPEAKP